MAINPVVWFEIYVQDMARAKRFYEAVLGQTLTQLESPIPDMELWSFPMQQDVMGASGALVRMEGKDSGGGGTLIYFSCTDCSLEAAKAAANGGQLFREKFSIGQYGFIALVYDTEGNMIGLHSMQ
jgi:predicted enzyme related to lactoylglutathione lyase